MIADIIFSWNDLTVTMVMWFGCVSLAVAADFGPEIYRERRARAKLEKSIAIMAVRKTEQLNYDPGKFFEVGSFKIQPQPVRRRHAKV